MDNQQGPIVWHMKFYSIFVATWMGGEFGYMFTHGGVLSQST